MPRFRGLPCVLLALTIGLAVAPAAHAQDADVEGVWSFSGGQVAVKAQPDGTFAGTVVRVTTFSQCNHPVGETMWAGMSRQPDGQYWGGHQWFDDVDCSPKQRGPTAFRVLQRPDGNRFLRVCFGKPEQPGTQPKIAPDGSSSDVTDECLDSDLVAPLVAPTLRAIATLPSQGSRGCLSRRSFRIRLKEPPGDALVSARVTVNGKPVATRTGSRLTAAVVLTGLPKGRYAVRITAKTVLGRTVSGVRRYRTCAPRKKATNRSRV